MPSGAHAARGASDIDGLCERVSTVPYSGSFGPSKGCQCASRAYQRDPLPDDALSATNWTPIWARNTEDE